MRDKEMQQQQPPPLAPAARALSFEPAQRRLRGAALAAFERRLAADAAATAAAAAAAAPDAPRPLAAIAPAPARRNGLLHPQTLQHQQHHHQEQYQQHQRAPRLGQAQQRRGAPPSVFAAAAAAASSVAAAAHQLAASPHQLMQPPPVAQLPLATTTTKPAAVPAPYASPTRQDSGHRPQQGPGPGSSMDGGHPGVEPGGTTSSAASTLTAPVSTPSSVASSLSADSIFQAKAQVAAYRAVSRGVDPAPELLIASAGKRPRPTVSQALVATATEARSSASATAMDSRRTIDDLPLYPPHHDITIDDVRIPGELVSDSALRQRVRRLRVRQHRIRAELVARGLPVPTVAMSAADIRSLLPNLDPHSHRERCQQHSNASARQFPTSTAPHAQVFAFGPSCPSIAAVPSTSATNGTQDHRTTNRHSIIDAPLPVRDSRLEMGQKIQTQSPSPSHRRPKVVPTRPNNGLAGPIGGASLSSASIRIAPGAEFLKSDACSGFHVRTGDPTAVAAIPITVPREAQGVPLDTLLETRERRLEMRVEARLSELCDLPIDVPSEIRSRAVIEAKSLRLVRMQRAIRDDVTAVMYRLLAPPPPLGFGASAIKKYCHPAPVLHASANVQSSGTGNGTGALSKDALNRICALEKRHREEQEERRRRRQSQFVNALLSHASSVRTVQHAKHQLNKKLLKDLERHFRDKVREEDRRKKREQQDRLRALRNNDEEQYLALLQNTKNTRLLQLLSQTDEYLSQLGARVEAQKVASRAEEVASRGISDRSADVEGDPGQEQGESSSDDVSATGDRKEAVHAAQDATSGGSDTCGGDADSAANSVQALRARRNQYYTISHSIREKVSQPKSLVGGTLKPYQVDGLEWMVSLYNNGLNGILADEMGLGKTIQTISLLTYLVEVKMNVGPFLVIVPLSTMSNWVRELETWAPSLVKVIYRGNPETRKNIQLYEMAGRCFNVVLTTYEFVVKDKNYLGKIRWKYIIIDEGHRMKNADCKLALTLGAKYHTRNRILLTGTPLQNNLTELWALLNFLLPSIFSSADTFETWFNAPFQASSLGGSTELNEEEQLLVISRLHQVLRPFMLRRLKTDVETQLPEKVESVLRCEMSVWQRVLYRQMTSNIGIASAGSVRTFNNIVMQLKKVCNHPYLFYSDEELMSVPRDFLIRAAGKFEMLEHAFRKLKASGHRVLLFSQMTAALDYLEYFMSSMGLKHMRLDGTTKAEDRQTMLERFNDPGSEYFCFLLSTRAGGLGLNLQTADTVFIFDSDWNPMMDLQAQDRAHRIGQTKEVRVFRLITANSVEEKILERANQKLHMDAQIIQAGQFNNKSSDTDRTQMLKQILQAQVKGDDEDEDIPSPEALNRMLARSEEEFDLFQDMDRERFEHENEQGFRRLMTDESVLPEWVLQPESKDIKKEDEDMSSVDNHGRGRRKRAQVLYDDGLTDKEWTAVVEQDGDVLEASKRKRRKVKDIPLEFDGDQSSGAIAELEPPGAEMSGDDDVRVIDDP